MHVILPVRPAVGSKSCPCLAQSVSFVRCLHFSVLTAEIRHTTTTYVITLMETSQNERNTTGL